MGKVSWKPVAPRNAHYISAEIVSANAYIRLQRYRCSMTEEHIDRRVRDIAIKLKEQDGKVELSAMRLVIEGYTGTHITSFFRNEDLHCDCTAFVVHKSCIHLKVAEILKYMINSIIPTLEVGQLFDKAKVEKQIVCQQQS